MKMCKAIYNWRKKRKHCFTWISLTSRNGLYPDFWTAKCMALCCDWTPLRIFLVKIRTTAVRCAMCFEHSYAQAPSKNWMLHVHCTAPMIMWLYLMCLKIIHGNKCLSVWIFRVLLAYFCARCYTTPHILHCRYISKWCHPDPDGERS